MSNLLLVDDDAFVRGALTRALNRAGGFTVIPAEHGRHALELLATEHVDAILTDLQMPVMMGSRCSPDSSKKKSGCRSR